MYKGAHIHKYQQEPDEILDLHGCTTAEAKVLLDELFADYSKGHIRIIIGKGLNSAHGPVIPYFVKNYLNDKGFDFSYAEARDGGEGALEVFL